MVLNLLDLPDDILDMIASRLNLKETGRLVQTCRMFNSIAWSRGLPAFLALRKLDAFMVYVIFSEAQWRKFKSFLGGPCGQIVQHLRFGWPSDKFTLAEFPTLPNVKVLEIYGRNNRGRTDSGRDRVSVRSIAQGTPNVEKVYLFDLDLGDFGGVIADHWRANLKVLDIVKCLGEIGANWRCESFVKGRFAFNIKVTDDGLKELIRTGHQTLEVLQIASYVPLPVQNGPDGHPLPLFDPPVNQDGVEIVPELSLCQNLHTLGMSRSYIHDTDLFAIRMPELRQLSHLHLHEGASVISYRQLSTIFSQASFRLRKLYLWMPPGVYRLPPGQPFPDTDAMDQLLIAIAAVHGPTMEVLAIHGPSGGYRTSQVEPTMAEGQNDVRVCSVALSDAVLSEELPKFPLLKAVALPIDTQLPKTNPDNEEVGPRPGHFLSTLRPEDLPELEICLILGWTGIVRANARTFAHNFPRAALILDFLWVEGHRGGGALGSFDGEEPPKPDPKTCGHTYNYHMEEPWMHVVLHFGRVATGRASSKGPDCRKRYFCERCARVARPWDEDCCMALSLLIGENVTNPLRDPYPHGMRLDE